MSPKLKIRVLFALLTLLTMLPAAESIAGTTFCNPINVNYRFSIAPPCYREAADPDIITFNHEYYLFASHSGGYWWSTNFLDWNLVIPTGVDIEKWAPSVIVISNTMYYTSSQSGDIYKTTDPKGGAWTHVSHPTDWGDPALFVDDDGSVYCYINCSANGSIDVVRLDPDNNFSVIGSVVHCFYSKPGAHGFEVPGDNNDSYGADTWIEGAWMTKYKGAYYLQYAVPGTQYRSYCDGAYISTSPMGPFTFCANSPVSARPLGFVTGPGHGCVFQDLDGNYWKADTVTISVNHMFERRLAVFPAGFDGNGVLHCDTALGDFPQYLPGQMPNPVTNNFAGWYLLSAGKAATASSQDTNGLFSPGNAFDENIRTWWAAATGNSGEWLQVDLGKNCTVDAVQVNFAEQDGTYWGGRTTTFSYRYKMEYSVNGSAWNMLVDKSANTNDFPHDYIELTKAATARYIKITNLGAVPGGGKFAISDLRVFGNGRSGPPGQVRSVTATRNIDQRKAAISWSGAANASGYIIRCGIAPDKLYNSYEVLSGTSYTINSLNVGQDYFFTVDSFNDSGLARGTNIASALAQWRTYGNSTAR